MKQRFFRNVQLFFQFFHKKIQTYTNILRRVIKSKPSQLNIRRKLVQIPIEH